MRLKVRKSTLFRIGLVAAVLVISMLVFASLAEDLVNQETLSTLDPVFGKWLIAHTSLSGNHIFSTITFLGNSLIISIGTGLLGFWLAKRKLWNQLIFLLLIIGGSALLNLLLKNIFQRSRPAFTLAYQVETGFSFPSGHAMIAYLAFALLKSRRGKVLVGIGAVVLSAIIGFSRLYLGVHYLTDVLAGWAAGALCLMLAILGDYCFDLSKGKRQA
jgi:membrane-associated phospholipid phosphatase